MKFCTKILWKTLVWRGIASATTFVSVLVTEGTYEKAGIITILDITFKTLFYYIHEKVWDKQKCCFQKVIIEQEENREEHKENKQSTDLENNTETNIDI